MKKSYGKAVVKYVVLFLVGGLLYGSIEILWRGYTHPSMIVVGGIGFLLVGGINDWFPRQISIIGQGLIGGTIITGLERSPVSFSTCTWVSEYGTTRTCR